ncbi:HAD-like domain-containing protein [Gilbertella persicaria]|uniref:HAD-like domain-containing protein n=1 Tax=Gilbertella persicaria TaxID=101096 RepID=UPI00221E84D4|nr:HAD-like domain-containing protein [Gilbertella persicaria]KAI8068140.1 HAD-like domain-containing protein [Gilbertella persicaria]
MFRRSILGLQKAARRSYSATPEQPLTNSAAHKLAEEALAQKTGAVKPRAATLPKGDKKPTKAKSEKNNHYKTALGAGAAVGLGLGAMFYYGRPFEDGRQDKYAAENPFVAAYKRCVDRFNEFQQSMHEPIWDKLLPDPLPQPYQRPYTLVINLDETLVYSYWDKDHGWRHAKRPGVDYFLSYLSQFFEIVIFTSQSSMNAMPILDKLDPYQYAMYRLYREATRYVDGKYVKDLSHLNRDLSKVIIMDSNPEAFTYQPENGIALKPWKGEAGDQGLLEYIPFLEAVGMLMPEDVRTVLKTFEGQHIPIAWAKREEEMKELSRIQWEQEQAQKKSSRNLGSLLGGGAAATQVEGPPPSPLEMLRKEYREAFASQFETQKKAQEEAMAQDMERQMQMMKEMKMSVWDLMAQAASGQPLAPPPPPSNEQPQQ